MIRRTTYINRTTKSDASTLPLKLRNRQEYTNKQDNSEKNNENNNNKDQDKNINNYKHMSSSMKRLYEELKRCSQGNTEIMHLRQTTRQRKLDPTPASYYGNDDYEMLSEDSASSDDEKCSNFSDDLNDFESSESEDDDYLANEMSPQPSTRTNVTALVSPQMKRPASALQSDSVGNKIIFQMSEPPKDVATTSLNMHDIRLENPDGRVTSEQIQDIRCRFRAMAAAQHQNRRTESHNFCLEQLQPLQVPGSQDVTTSMTTCEQILQARNQLQALVGVKLEKGSSAQSHNHSVENLQPMQMAGTPDVTTRTTTTEQIQRLKDQMKALYDVPKETQSTALMFVRSMPSPTLIHVQQTKPVIESPSDAVKDTPTLHNNRQLNSGQASQINGSHDDNMRSTQYFSLDVLQRNTSLQTSHVSNTQASQSNTLQNRSYISSQTSEINRLQVDGVRNLQQEMSENASPGSIHVKTFPSTASKPLQNINVEETQNSSLSTPQPISLGTTSQSLQNKELHNVIKATQTPQSNRNQLRATTPSQMNGIYNNIYGYRPSLSLNVSPSNMSLATFSLGAGPRMDRPLHMIGTQSNSIYAYGQRLSLTKTQNNMSPVTLCIAPGLRMQRPLHINGTQGNDVNRLSSTLTLNVSPNNTLPVSLSPQPVSLKLGTVLPPMQAAILSDLAKQKQKDTNGQVPIKIDLKNRSTLSDCTVEKTASQDMEVDAVKESATPEPTYLCHYCHKELSSPSKLERHLATKHRHIGGMFKCSYCSDVFFTKDKYARHLTLHGEKTQASCKFCKETFESVDLLVEHIPTHSPKKQQNQQQIEPNHKETNGIDEIRLAEDDSESQKKNGERSDRVYKKQPTEQHRSLNDDPKILQSERDSVAVDTHNNLQPTDGIGLDCPSVKQPEKQSKIQTKDPEQLKQTDASHSTKDKQRNDSHESDATRKMKKCEHCGQSFRHYFAWRLHVKTHNESKVFSCQLCSKWYLTIRQLSEHVVTHMRDKKPKCEACLLSFRSNQDLMVHKEICTDVKFQCKRRKCHAVFFNFKDYNDHMVGHHSDSITCKICGRYYGRDYSKLKTHLLVHTGERPFACKICGKRFRANALLKNHLLTHEKTKKFQCDVCGKTFQQPAALHRHKKTHNISLKLVHQCEICRKTFTQSCSLQRHLRIHTGERFKCLHCSQTFIEAWRMREHVKKKH